jgi:HK97 family phage major capsid protein
MSALQALKDKRAEAVSVMRLLVEKAEKEDRGFSTDEDAKWAAADTDLQALEARIKRSEQLEQSQIIVPTTLRAAPRNLVADELVEDELDEKRVFDKFMRQGAGELSTEQRAVLMKRRSDAKEIRSFSAGTGNTGAFTVPQAFLDQLDIALKAFGGMMNVASVLRTDTGATMPMPSFNYTSTLATIVGENTAGPLDSSTPFSAVNLGAYTYRSPILPVSYEFLQDSAFGEGFIVDALGQSIARAVNAHATNGTGTGQPRGVITDAILGKAGTTGQTTSVIFDDLVDMVHSIDPAYRAMNCRWMMHDSSLRVVRKIKDTQGRPIFLPGYEGLTASMGDSLFGYPIAINQDMPVMAASAKSVLFGRFDKYKLRMVRDVSMLRLTERYADSLQVAFILFMRADGRLLDAGTNPIKYYANSAT